MAENVRHLDPSNNKTVFLLMYSNNQDEIVFSRLADCELNLI